MRRLFTSESVTEGHPDKVCDQIADAILDAILAQDEDARVACECCAKNGLMLLMGEVTTTANVDYDKIARRTIARIGYTDDSKLFSANNVKIIKEIEHQSPDIAQGVSRSQEYKNSEARYDRIGAGDQGMMFGYACNETAELMPMPIMTAHRLTKRLAEVRKTGLLPYLRPDGKAQVTVEYENGTPKRVEAVVVSTQHDEFVELETLRSDIKKHVIDYVIDDKLIDSATKLFINPTDRFVTGGPEGDSGLTGRKIIVDTYGGYCTHGGGSFSGKDATKVDRSAAYMSRYVCKNIVAAGLAKRCRLDIAYAIGVANPVSVCVNTDDTGILPDDKLSEIVKKVFDFRPAAIIDKLELTKGGFERVAAYGHYGNGDVKWEKCDMIETLQKAAAEEK